MCGDRLKIFLYKSIYLYNNRWLGRDSCDPSKFQKKKKHQPSTFF